MAVQSECTNPDPHGPHSTQYGPFGVKHCPGVLTLRERAHLLRIAAIDDALARVRDELIRATERFGPMASAHEGYAVILEELDEMWDEVKANSTKRAREEAVQVAAMATRFLIDVQPEAGGE